MSIATTILRRIKDEYLAQRRRFQIVKVVIGFSFVLLLMYGGFQGRQQARLQVKINEMTDVRNQLQQKLDEEQKPIEQLIGGVRGTDTSEIRPRLSNAQVMTLVSALRTRLEQFDSNRGRAKLSAVQDLETRLSKAILANAEQRFAEALTIVTGDDEKRKRARTEAEIRRFAPVLQIRGDSFYGLHEWREALDRYQQVLTLKPDRIATRARAAECHYALGRTNEALTTYDGLAKSHNHRGDALLVQGKPDMAMGHYEKAIEIQTRLIAQGRSEVASELAKSHNNRGHALFVQKKADAAIGPYEKAIEIQTRLVEQQARSELSNDLAESHGNLGNALLGQQKLDAVIDHYGKAIEIQTRLSEQKGRSELALTCNNRGVVRRVQGNLEGAIADFDAAIRILTAIIEQQGRDKAAAIQTNRGPVRGAQVKLDVVIGYPEKDVELQTRPRLAEQAGQRELALALAMILKNRGYAHLVQRKLDGAIEDFKKATEIYARLVEQEGHTDLALPFAMSLSSLAWIYATNPDTSFRDGGSAKEYARKACELTDWRAFVPLQTLAAACAETGSFADAVKWQEKALERAPREEKVEARSRLQLYKAGKPYRALPKAE